MEPLNLPHYNFRYKEIGGKMFIFDEVRQKFVSLTPEEWVRQHFLQFMKRNLNYPSNLTGVERKVNVNGLTQRCDIILYNRKGQPVMIVECKAPSVNIDETTLAQAARYNTTLGVPYLVLTNGLKHYCIRIENDKGRYSLERQFPTFDSLQ
ncbi:type I restriction enzyme HsdR N-terminal domain-containing protein [Thermophagus xiamenensis]|uniref:Type I restriction enzyme R protein N terminus (HSDR_N) n=1 Tax=Thermophagus xiamenensis TaxID=385682 RepID=A0A1I2C677_9BACT|nr:type I restriction enzyme HsdR N-terminal domain-containing protein [Thermophagus xiamenensis]SFE63652.1 Type I restriction enzyme R protein N terminus (HSDR_N) [Thermophagus xiamenensis]